MKKLVLILLTLGAAMSLHAQEPFTFTQFFQVPQAINPAFSGIEDYLDLKVGYRQRETGLQNAPRNYFLSANYSFRPEPRVKPRISSLRVSDPNSYKESDLYDTIRSKVQRHGIGGFVQNRTLGPLNLTHAYLSYAIHVPLSKKVTASLGLSASYTGSRLDSEGDFFIRDINDPVYQSLLNQEGRQSFLDLNVGMVVYGENFYAGYSAYQVSRAQLGANATDPSIDQESIYNITHVGSFGYSLNLGLQWEFLPSVLFAYNPAFDPIYTLNAKMRYRGRFWGGAAYRSSEALAFMVGFLPNDFINISYSYDYTISDAADFSNGNHEIILGLMLLNKNFRPQRTW